MDPNKIYKDIVYLLYNILGNEKLRYELYKDSKYRDLYIQAVDDLLTLEKNDEATFDGTTWATAFGKAIVVISQSKQRFERQEKKSVEKIYEDYSKLIAYSMNSFGVKRDELTQEKIKFTEADVLYNGRLSEDVIKKYDDLSKQEAAEKEAQKAQENMFVNDGDKKAKPGDEQSQQNNNQGSNYGGFGGYGFGAGPNGQAFQDFANNMPKNPMQDPRFYPFDRKPKFMPWLKMALGVVVIVTAIMLICASAFAMSKTVNLSDYKGPMSAWQVIPDITKQNSDITTLGQIGNHWSLATGDKNAAMNIIAYTFYCIPAIYVGWMAFSKPRSLADKYRISYWPIIFMVIFFALSIIDNYQFASNHELKNLWSNQIKNWIQQEQWNDGQFNDWWQTILTGQQVTRVTVLMDVAIGLLGTSVIFGIVMCFFNPHIDKAKYQKAMMEYQKAVMSIAQGIPYTMDPSLFENDDNVIIHNKSKFTLWCEKVWNKMAFWKHKKNNKKDN